jgi:hypothetical protein
VLVLVVVLEKVATPRARNDRGTKIAEVKYAI